MSATERAVRVAKSLSQNCDMLYVFTLGREGIPSKWIDSELEADFLKDLPINIKIIEINSLFKNILFIDKKNGLTMENILGTFSYILTSDLGLFWTLRLCKDLKKYAKELSPKYLIFTCPFFLPILLGVILKRKLSIPYLIDYRDLWFNKPMGHFTIIGKYFSYIIEKFSNKRALLITTISKTYINELVGSNQNKLILYNFNNKINNFKFEKKNNLDHFNIVYIGSIYKGQRSFKPILQALALIDKEIRDNIYINYYGDQGDILKKEFNEYCDLNLNFYDNGRVLKENINRLIAESDMLISLVHTDEVTSKLSVRGIMTGKIFEYLVSKKPVLNIAPKNAELVEFFKEFGQNQVFSHTANDIVGISKTILYVKKSRKIIDIKELPTWDEYFNEFWCKFNKS